MNIDDLKPEDAPFYKELVNKSAKQTYYWKQEADKAIFFRQGHVRRSVKKAEDVRNERGVTLSLIRHHKKRYKHCIRRLKKWQTRLELAVIALRQCNESQGK